jgi:hypothetical protein
MMRRRLELRSLSLTALLLASGCAATTSDEEAGSTEAAVNAVSGSETSDHILYPGDPACGGPCEKSIAGADLYIPARNGSPWGDTYALGKEKVDSAGGYSSGRIALLRRLAFLPNGQRVALLLDPSWPDGERNFTGSVTTGPNIVKTWLEGAPNRKFVLIHSTTSVGWKEYDALRSSTVGAQVRVCSVAAGHLDVPKTVGHGAIVAPDQWDNGTCVWGSDQPPATGCTSTTLGRVVPPGACVQKATNLLWYRCEGDNVWADSSADDPRCTETHPRP